MKMNLNRDFPRILTLLRKEKGLSQKQAAQDLTIPQALLSHYEKGIREPGLEFVVRAPGITAFPATTCWAAPPTAAARLLPYRICPAGLWAGPGSTMPWRSTTSGCLQALYILYSLC